MRNTLLAIAVLLCGTGCDPSRVYEQNTELEDACWPLSYAPAFTFSIPDTAAYNLYLNVRHESDFQTANLYVTWHLKDSTGRVMQEKLQTFFLFDKKSGKPLGRSGLGDLYDHQFPLLQTVRFPSPGVYTLEVTHFMRTDTLKHIQAIGARVERHLEE
jgi:gliding motility-associated lipoprotein GldH